MPSETDPYQARVGEARFRLRGAFEDLRGALHRFGLLADGLPQGPDGAALAQALADANRALALAQAQLREQERLADQGACPRCQGKGSVAARGAGARRARCPACDGNGRVAVPRPPDPAPAGPRGRWQRLILTRLLALGGASWAVPLRRLWGRQAPSGAERAAFCRALAALERRGLLWRSQRRPAGRRVRRATRARLTAAGAEWAETLTNTPER